MPVSSHLHFTFEFSCPHILSTVLQPQQRFPRPTLTISIWLQLLLLLLDTPLLHWQSSLMQLWLPLHDNIHLCGLSPTLTPHRTPSGLNKQTGHQLPSPRHNLPHLPKGCTYRHCHRASLPVFPLEVSRELTFEPFACPPQRLHPELSTS